MKIAVSTRLFIPEKREQAMAVLSAGTVGVFLLTLIGFSVSWFLGSADILNLKEIVVFKSQEYEFYIDFYFDKVTFIFAIVGAILAFLCSSCFNGL